MGGKFQESSNELTDDDMELCMQFKVITYLFKGMYYAGAKLITEDDQQNIIQLDGRAEHFDYFSGPMATPISAMWYMTLDMDRKNVLKRMKDGAAT